MGSLEELLNHKKSVQENISKSFGSGFDLNEEWIEKAKSGVYADTAENRKLNRVGQQYGNKRQEKQPKGKTSAKQEEGGADVSSQAAKASDGALKRAASDEKAPEHVRNAAKQELEKRGVGGDEKKWDKIFDKMKKVNGSFQEEMYEDLAELAKKHGVDYDDEGEESLKKLPIKEVEKIVNSYKGGNVDNSKGNKKAWKSVFNKLRHAESADMYDNLWELGQKYDVDLSDYGDEEEMDEVIKNNIPIKEVQKVISKYKRTV